MSVHVMCFEFIEYDIYSEAAPARFKLHKSIKHIPLEDAKAHNSTSNQVYICVVFSKISCIKSHICSLAYHKQMQ